MLSLLFGLLTWWMVPISPELEIDRRAGVLDVEVWTNR